MKFFILLTPAYYCADRSDSTYFYLLYLFEDQLYYQLRPQLETKWLIDLSLRPSSYGVVVYII